MSERDPMPDTPDPDEYRDPLALRLAGNIVIAAMFAGCAVCAGIAIWIFATLLIRAVVP